MSMTYTAGDPPSNPADFQRFMRQELAKLEAVIGGLHEGHIDRSYVLPAKPRDGDLRYFDASIAPGGLGTGIYLFDGTTWAKL
ncbi:MAG TPA: hypothetical protein VGE56_00750 [Rhodocyclaceae bacterium]